MPGRDSAKNRFRILHRQKRAKMSASCVVASRRTTCSAEWSCVQPRRRKFATISMRRFICWRGTRAADRSQLCRNIRRCCSVERGAFRAVSICVSCVPFACHQCGPLSFGFVLVRSGWQGHTDSRRARERSPHDIQEDGAERGPRVHNTRGSCDGCYRYRWCYQAERRIAIQ